MDTVQIEQLSSGGNIGESTIILSTGGGVSQDCGDGEDAAQGMQATMNGQLEIEIPAGESRQGAIHTIQLQSPGGNTHIVEGLVVSNATAAGQSDGVDGMGETALFHSSTAGTFILPTSQCNSLATQALIASSSVSPSGGGGTCEVITADASDHHILSGLQVVRVTTGENSETIFLVPTTGGGKEGMQPVMVLQSTEDITEDQSQAAQEVVEEAVELNIPSPKPVLTQVKQEGAEQHVTGSDMVLGNESEVVQHYDPPAASVAPTTLVVVAEGGDDGGGSTSQTNTRPSPSSSSEKMDKKPAVNGHNGKQETTPTTSSTGFGDRPQRKAAIKAVATRKAALASLTSPRKQQSTPKSPRNKGKAAQNTTTTTTTAQQQQNSTFVTSDIKPIITSVASAETPKKMVQVVTTTPVRGTTNTAAAPAPPSPFVSSTRGTAMTTVQVQQPPRVILAGGTPIQATPRSYFLLPEDIVSESDDEGEGTPVRKCLVCLRRRRFTETVFDVSRAEEGSRGETITKCKLLQNVEMLIAHLNIPLILQGIGRPNEVGICPSCLDSLQRWHIFNSAITKRHETVKTSGQNFDDSPVSWEVFETRVYRNYRKMAKVKEVYFSATHSHLTRRQMTEKDWDFFCDHLFRFNSLKSEKARELERYVTSREKLTHFYCVKCQRLVKNGRKGFVKHMKTQHPHDTVLLPCDICGNHFHDKGAPPSNEEYYPHWISHFYFNSCEECGKRFPTKRALGQHKQTAHKNRNAQWTSNKPSASTGAAATNSGGPQEDRPWKCDQCDASFKMKGALVSHRDVVHLNRKNHVCSICGEAFKSASSLRGHVRRHEGRRDYKCEVCHKEYYTYSALKGHKVVHQTARDFICGICGKAFKKKKALEEHGTLHTGVKPHRCPICGREIRVKSNLYKHMKIHKKNAELGIVSGRGRHSLNNAASTSAGSSVTTTGNASSSSTVVNASTLLPKASPAPRLATSVTTPNKKAKVDGKMKVVKVQQLQQQQNPVTMKEEQEPLSTYPQTSNAAASALKMNTTTSPVQGATAVDVVLENAAELTGGEHRGPIVVSIVTDGLGGGPANILHMNQDQQQQLLNAVTSLANSHGQTVTIAGAGGATFLASHLQAATSSAGVVNANRNSLVTTSTSGGSDRSEDQVLAVPTTQYYTAQQFFNSLDHLQN